MILCAPSTLGLCSSFVSRQRRSFQTARATYTRCSWSNTRYMRLGPSTYRQSRRGSRLTSFVMLFRLAIVPTASRSEVPSPIDGTRCRRLRQRQLEPAKHFRHRPVAALRGEPEQAAHLDAESLFHAKA